MEKNIEQQVREALIEKTAEEAYRHASTPEYKAFILEFAEDIASGLVDVCSQGEEMTIAEREELLRELKNTFHVAVAEEILSEKNLRKMSREIAEGSYRTYDQFVAAFEEKLAGIEIDENDEKLRKQRDEYIATTKASFLETLKPAVDSRSRIVQKLTEIAEEHGVEYAVKEEIEHAVIREILPTPEDYQRAYSGVLGGISDWIDTSTTFVSEKDPEAGEMLGSAMGPLKKFFERIPELVERMRGQTSEEKIKKIYTIS